MVKILHIASEASPFIKTGGLADVIGSLPKALHEKGLDVRVVLPKYGTIEQHWKEQMVWEKSITVPLAWRNQFCGIETICYEGITFYFLDNEYYYNRDHIYGYEDDGERFAFFCRAALAFLPHIDFQPQILHCHDWHTGLVSVFLEAFYNHLPFYQNMGTIFTIHNLQYQGVFPKYFLGDVLGLDDSYFTIDSLEYQGQINFMKGGLVFSDLLTTVSKSYSEEIQTPYFGESLDGLLRKRRKQLFGIINGIDYDLYSPNKDPHIFLPYYDNLQDKSFNKVKLQEALGLSVDSNTPMIAIISRLVSSKGLDLVVHILDELLSLDVQLVILGTGEAKYEELFQQAMIRYPSKLSVHIQFDDSLARKIYAASDLFLMPSRFEPCGIGQLIALRYGSIPIVRETGGLKDTVQSYNDYRCTGNGFSFTHYNAHDMLFTIQRALKSYQDKKLWIKVFKNAIYSDFSWHQSAQQYTHLYKTLTFQTQKF
ncbi:starch synthase [Anaerosolibacter carboniphilus]|uniref:Glycogen synthase n=1 Tax=Anaerosolibacter carboniphilus TaxID=1417629 RepID=A0A841KUC4_9FIRM|nr:glycogen synthase GlgA [Anaerosolibacter carboniphilus]MBB6215788.1 starch synthase [Anaerosolibacter carboniphilus]